MSKTATAYQLVAFYGYNLPESIKGEGAYSEWFSDCINAGVPRDILVSIASNYLSVPVMHSVEGLSKVGDCYYDHSSGVLYGESLLDIEVVKSGLLSLSVGCSGNMSAIESEAVDGHLLSSAFRECVKRGASELIVKDGLVLIASRNEDLLIGEITTFDTEYALTANIKGVLHEHNIAIDKAGNGVAANRMVFEPLETRVAEHVDSLLVEKRRNVAFFGGAQSSVFMDMVERNTEFEGVVARKWDGSDNQGGLWYVRYEELLKSAALFQSFLLTAMNRENKFLINTSATLVEEVVTPYIKANTLDLFRNNVLFIAAGLYLDRLCSKCKKESRTKSTGIVHLSLEINSGKVFTPTKHSNCTCVKGFSGRYLVEDVMDFTAQFNTSIKTLDGYKAKYMHEGDNSAFYSIRVTEKNPGLVDFAKRAVVSGEVCLDDMLENLK